MINLIVVKLGEVKVRLADCGYVESNAKTRSRINVLTGDYRWTLGSGGKHGDLS